MPYTADGTLEHDLFPGVEFIEETGKAMVDAVIDRWRDKVAFRTPVARLPEAYKGDFEAWIQDRGFRTPRTMRDSWRRTTVFKDDVGHTAEVYSDEPIDIKGRQKVDLVEDDTRPHLIRAKPKIRINQRTGEVIGYQGSLRFPMGAHFMYRVEVHHPGTQGVHMMRDTELEIDVLWEEIAGPILTEKEREAVNRL